jgi:hypothetical protein
LIPSALHAVFQVAIFDIFKKGKKSTDEYAIYLKGGRKSYSEQARPRRRPDNSFRDERAKRIARRYEFLFPRVAKIRKFIERNRNVLYETDLHTAVEKEFPTPWIRHVTQGAALQELPNVPRHEHKNLGTTLDSQNEAHDAPSLASLDWTVRQLTAAIITCEETKIQTRLRASTILDNYLPRGRKLLSARSPR